MTLTVRLDPGLEAALQEHCAELGVPKSVVVRLSLAQYLLADGDRRSTTRRAKGGGAAPSAAFRAFLRAGLIAGAALECMPADKAAARRRVTGD